MNTTRIALILTVLALLSASLIAPGCASRADWEAGLEQAQTISDTAGSELGRVRQIVADLEADLAEAEPGSEFAHRLRDELARAQEHLSLIHQQKQVADQKIQDYRDRLAALPEDAEPWEINTYMIGEGAKDISRIVPSPIGEILFGAGVLLAGVSSAGWRKSAATARSKDHALKATVHAIEVAREQDPDLKAGMHKNQSIIHAAMGPDVRRAVDSIRKGA